VESADDVTDLTVLSVNAASTALTLSNVPWQGPVGCVRVRHTPIYIAQSWSGGTEGHGGST
jgi:polyribonucleotide nucleotidyltransferase